MVVICQICGEDVTLIAPGQSDTPVGRCAGCGETYYMPGYPADNRTVLHVSPKEWAKIKEALCSAR